jgi:hypothetical protein
MEDGLKKEATEGQQGHACREHGPGAVFLGTGTPTVYRLAHIPRASSVQIREVQQQQARARHQAQTPADGTPPQKESGCGNGYGQDEGADGQQAEKGQSESGTHAKPCEEPRPL